MCKKQQTWAPHSEPKIDVKNEAIFGFTPMTNRSRLPEIEAKNGLHKTQTIQNEKRCRCAQKKPPTGVPSLFLRTARRTSKQMAHQLKVAILQLAKQDVFLFMPHQARFNNHRQLLVCHVGTEEVHPWVSTTKHFSDAWNGFKELPPAPPCQCWRHKREKSNAPACAQSKRPFVDARSNIEIPGARGYTSSNNEI